MTSTVKFTAKGTTHEVLVSLIDGDASFTLCGEWVGGTAIHEGIRSDVNCRKCHPLPIVRQARPAWDTTVYNTVPPLGSRTYR